MGKEGELWDDSALINAFDDAMSKYKVHSPSLYTFHFFFFEFYSLLLIFTFLILQKMHGKKRIQDKSTDGGKFGGGTEDENASAITRVDESLDETVK